MSKTLIITEKPSLAKAIAEFLEYDNKDGLDYCCKSKNITITPCRGHFMELFDPEDYDETYKNWSFKNLPIIPTHFLIKVKNDKFIKQRYSHIKKLTESHQTIINAGDPDREGNLLIDWLLESMGVIDNQNKVLKRWWNLSDLNFKALAKSYAKIEPLENYKGYTISAKARAYADWLIGINYSRAFTLWFQKNNISKTIISIGRVQTPTLALIVKRFLNNKDFVSQTFYDLEVYSSKDDIKFTAKYSPPKKEEEEETRFFNPDKLKQIEEEIQGKTLRVKEYNKTEKIEKPPKGYNLSNLQIEANKSLSLSPSETLIIAQSLYEKKLTTYPRSDCSYLPSTQFENSPEIINHLKNYLNLDYPFNNNLRSPIWNDKKITAHHAIIPTISSAKEVSLNEKETQVYNLIANRYLEQFLEDSKYNQSLIVFDCENHVFKTTGKQYFQIGWRVLNQKDNLNNEPKLPILNIGELIDVENTKIQTKQTTPPKLFTEGDLIKIMSNAHLILDEATDDLSEEDISKYKKILKDTDGLGTEATRSGIIETLKTRKYITFKGKQIIPTSLGLNIIEVFNDNDIKSKYNFLITPSTTALYENLLSRMLDGTKNIDSFLKIIKNEINKIKYLESSPIDIKSLTPSDQPQDKSYKCPKCKKHNLKKIYLKDKSKKPFYICEGYYKDKSCNFTINTKILNKTLSETQIETLIIGKETGKIALKNPKTEKEFKTKLKLDKDYKIQFVFDKA